MVTSLEGEAVNAQEHEYELAGGPERRLGRAEGDPEPPERSDKEAYRRWLFDGDVRVYLTAPIAMAHSWGEDIEMKTVVDNGGFAHERDTFPSHTVQKDMAAYGRFIHLLTTFATEFTAPSLLEERMPGS